MKPEPFGGVEMKIKKFEKNEENMHKNCGKAPTVSYALYLRKNTNNEVKAPNRLNAVNVYHGRKETKENFERIK